MATPIEIFQSNRESVRADAYRAQRADRLADDAYRQIEALFVNGTLGPGSFVSEPQLQRLTGLGRAPVRDAVKRFEAERCCADAPQGFMCRRSMRRSPLSTGAKHRSASAAAAGAQEAERAALRACIARFHDETGNWDQEVSRSATSNTSGLSSGRHATPTLRR